MSELITLPHTGMQVPDASVTVSSLRYHGSRGEGFTATLRKGPAIVGVIDNDYCSGSAFSPNGKTGFGYDQLNAYAAACRLNGEPCSTETVINELVSEYECARNLAKYQKKGFALVMRMLVLVNPDRPEWGTATGAFYAQRTMPPLATESDRAAFAADFLRANPTESGQAWQWWDETAGAWSPLASKA